ncbi:MAG TPA: tetratricopeptide repeat protein [Anaerolineales bacterium]
MLRYLRAPVCVALLLVTVSCSVVPPAGPGAGDGTPPSGVPGLPQPTDTPLPTATPIPIVRVGSGDQALFNGDYETAIQQYSAAAEGTDDANIRAAALWGLARAQFADRRYESAIATARQLATELPDSPYAAPCSFLVAQSLRATQHPEEAAAAYANYIIGRPGVLDSFASELRGDALTEAGDDSGALDAYMSADAAPHLDDAQALKIKIAKAHAALGQYDTAIAEYDTIAANTTNDYVRAQLDYLAGQAYLSSDRSTQAYERFRHGVENYPISSYSYQGLVALLDAGMQVSDLDRGLTDYYAGIYDKALEALGRYIADNPGNDGTAYYYRALSLDQLQQYPEALDAYSYFIQNYANHPKWADAWFEKSTIEWFNQDRYPEAAQTMIDFVKASPGAIDAPEALMTAARILERDGRFDDAAVNWQRVGDEYPTYELASTALLFAGIMQFRQADFPAAVPYFDRSLVLAVTTEDQARAHLWIGKAREKMGDAPGAQNAWQLAQTADPGGYYSERASDLLNGRAPFSPPAITNLDFDLTAERQAADSWMRLTFNLAPETDLSGLDTLASDPRLIRGREFWNLGLYDEARLEFEDLRAAVSADAVLTYRLANFLLDLGLYRSGITAARQVLTLAGLQDQQSSMLAPPYFTHVRYGLYFRELVIPAAEQNGFDPLFLFSVVRQESLFEGFVSSTAGARGLMQIVPDTGAGIAQQIGWPIDFEPDDLYRPNVSIAYGAHYLAGNRQLLGGDLYAALAAYNGGPGNAVQWQQLAHGDPDLFLETVRAQETRDYIRRIYEIYIIYRRLYGPTA